jgi:hypothetical protein
MKSGFFALIFLMPALAFSRAGNDQGNGGDGLRRNGKLYVLDLVEAGAELKPFFSKTVVTNPKISCRLETVFSSQSVPTKLLSLKLSEIEKVDKAFAEALLQTIELYSWRWVNAALVDIKDEDSSLDYPQKNLVQVAIRRGQNIKVNREAWKLLDDGNRAALIFHEAVYALIKPASSGIQSSPRAREVAGYLFTEELAKMAAKGLHRVLRDDLPSLAQAAQFLGVTPESINNIVVDSQGIWYGVSLRPNIDRGYGTLVGTIGDADDDYYMRMAEKYCTDNYAMALDYYGENIAANPLQISIYSGFLALDLKIPDSPGSSGRVAWEYEPMQGPQASVSVGAPSLMKCPAVLGPALIKVKKYANKAFGFK